MLENNHFLSNLLLHARLGLLKKLHEIAQQMSILQTVPWTCFLCLFIVPKRKVLLSGKSNLFSWLEIDLEV